MTGEFEEMTQMNPVRFRMRKEPLRQFLYSSHQGVFQAPQADQRYHFHRCQGIRPKHLHNEVFWYQVHFR